MGAVDVGEARLPEPALAGGLDELRYGERVAGEPERERDVAHVGTPVAAAQRLAEEEHRERRVVPRTEAGPDSMASPRGPVRQRAAVLHGVSQVGVRRGRRLLLADRAEDADGHRRGLVHVAGLLAVVQQAHEVARVLVVAHAAQREDRGGAQGAVAGVARHVAKRVEHFAPLRAHRIACGSRAAGDGARGAAERADPDQMLAVELPPDPPRVAARRGRAPRPDRRTRRIALRAARVLRRGGAGRRRALVGRGRRPGTRPRTARLQGIVIGRRRRGRRGRADVPAVRADPRGRGPARPGRRARTATPGARTGRPP